jgi:hypothetical protein
MEPGEVRLAQRCRHWRLVIPFLWAEAPFIQFPEGKMPVSDATIHLVILHRHLPAWSSFIGKGLAAPALRMNDSKQRILGTSPMLEVRGSEATGGISSMQPTAPIAHRCRFTIADGSLVLCSTFWQVLNHPKKILLLSMGLRALHGVAKSVDQRTLGKYYVKGSNALYTPQVIRSTYCFNLLANGNSSRMRGSCCPR